jgi:hypothetical protein
LLDAIRDYPGAEVFALMVSSAINSVCTIFTWLSPVIPMISGIIQCLPIPLRPELSFSTSLHFSALRPLRLIAAHENSRCARDLCRRFAIPLFHHVHSDVSLIRERLLTNRDWATLVYSVIDQRAYDDFTRCLTDKLKHCSFETQRGTPDWNTLNRVSKALLNEWGLDGNGVNDDFMADKISTAKESDNGLTDENRHLRGDSSHKLYVPENDLLRGHELREADLEAITGKLLQLPLGEKPAATNSRPASQRRLTKQFPQYEREIRQMDSLLARSLFGDTIALEALDDKWRELRQRLTFQEKEIIRDTYLHLVQSIVRRGGFG